MIFDVEVSREGRYWVATVAGVRGGATEARSLSSLDLEVRDLLLGLFDHLDEADIELHWNYEPAIGPHAAKALREYEDAKRDLSRATERYEQTQQTAVSELRIWNVSMRDAATLLRISFQRVSQIAEGMRELASH